MDNFLNQIEKRTNFYLDDTVQFRKTNSTLLNNSIFSKKWYLYDVETYNYFVEDYGDDFKKYLNEFYDNNDVDIEHSFLFTNPDMFIYGLDEKFAYFFDNTFETEDEFETNSSFKNTENIKKSILIKLNNMWRIINY
jgi:hypothetical protein